MLEDDASALVAGVDKTTDVLATLVKPDVTGSVVGPADDPPAEVVFSPEVVVDVVSGNQHCELFSDPRSDVYPTGQLEQVAFPTESLYVAFGQGVHLPRSPV